MLHRSTSAALLLFACGGSPSHQPPSRPPTAGSATVAEPGGDAAETHEAALSRLIKAPWGVATDKDDQLRLPLPDSDLWKRVRYWGLEHFVGFRYGNDHHALAVGFVQELPRGIPLRPDTCLRQFETWGLAQAQVHGVEFGSFRERPVRFRNQTLQIRFVDGHLSTLFIDTEFSGAWVAYPAYPRACFVYAIAVPWRHQADLARRVRDRWVHEGLEHVEFLTTESPQRR